MRFSVIITTRNRPIVSRIAIRSVLRQRHVDKEVIIVHDGSDSEHAQEYEQTFGQFRGAVRLLNLNYTVTGHGPSYTVNRGAEIATGEYLSFLDDDDEWTDIEHLSRAEIAISAKAKTVDLYLTNQLAFANGLPLSDTLWINGLAAFFPKSHETYEVNIEHLLQCGGFCHVNTMMIRREYFNDLRGMDETIRYESDQDLYLRAIDSAACILYRPQVTARHNVPDPSTASSMSTSVSQLEKYLFRLRVLDKAMIFSSSPLIRSHARTHKSYTLHRIAQELSELEQYDIAWCYSAQALATRFGSRWPLLTHLFRRLWGRLKSSKPCPPDRTTSSQ